MARPKKIGLEYFPLDCQMDDKVEMLEAEHGLEGFAVYIKLLQAIYQTEAGELDMSVIFRWKTLGKQWGIPAENLRKIVDTMLEVALFDKKAFEERQVLTSGGIEKRISQVAALRDRDRRRKTDGEPELSDGKPADKYTKGKGKDTNVSQREMEKEIDTTSSFQSEVVEPAKVETKPLPVKEKKEASHTRGAARSLAFAESPYASLQAVEAALAGTEYALADLPYYHEVIRNWAEGKGERKVDWLATIRGWILRDSKENKLKTIANIQPVNSYGNANRYGVTGHKAESFADVGRAVDCYVASKYNQ